MTSSGRTRVAVFAPSSTSAATRSPCSTRRRAVAVRRRAQELARSDTGRRLGREHGRWHLQSELSAAAFSGGDRRYTAADPGLFHALRRLDRGGCSFGRASSPSSPIAPASISITIGAICCRMIRWRCACSMRPREPPTRAGPRILLAALPITATSAAAGASKPTSRRWWSSRAWRVASSSSACSAPSIPVSWSTRTRSKRRSKVGSDSR